MTKAVNYNNFSKPETIAELKHFLGTANVCSPDFQNTATGQSILNAFSIKSILHFDPTNLKFIFELEQIPPDCINSL